MNTKQNLHIHSTYTDGKDAPEEYMRQVMTFAQKAASLGVIVVLRLWNQGGYDSANERLLELASEYVPRPWTERYDGWKMAD